jgi:putative membrane protein
LDRHAPLGVFKVKKKGVETMMHGFGYGGLGGYGGFGLIGLIFNAVIAVALLLALVLFIVWLWRRVNAGGQGMSTSQQSTRSDASAKEILQVRYARGEITREQYQQMLGDLT